MKGPKPFGFLALSVPALFRLDLVGAQYGNFPATGDNGDNGGIFGVGPDIFLSGFISPDKISGTLSLGSQSPPLSQVIPSVGQVLFSDASPGGTGPYPARWFTEPDLPAHTIYAPAAPPKDGKAMPVVVWGNGFCINVGNSYHPFLQEIASHGYLVIANGPPLAAIEMNFEDFLSSEGIASHPSQQTQAIDWVTAGKAGRYGNIDTKHIASAGQSCGGQEAYSSSYHDTRVVLTMLFNSGVFIPSRRYLLKALTAPVGYFCGGPIDLGYAVSLADYALLPEGLPAVWASLDTGHTGTYWGTNGGKDAQAAVAFLDWWFREDQIAKQKFVDPGSAGSLVSQDWNVTMKNID
ncbi:uncharacterized protein PV09_09028 [Verruconis gallopava]|uniref:Carboxylesterase type B domain-containing protein n=1 Tax=Verruconis gallopava TaxID=253628 RepID=A0A0D1ZXS2_9PEZI|nr:uncharacterized protein PV09_09028 [Verruconis gallopava]KIV99257.1 hypothetical protein PV09_09028 [Verruconis gallopava]